jgi:citrate synthase
VEPDPEIVRAFDIALILHTDHELNASTFAARVTAATMSDIYSAMTSAIGALKGPLHGGANMEVMKMLEEIGSADQAEKWVIEKLADNAKIPGFGHRVYRCEDPRVPILREYVRKITSQTDDTRLFEITLEVEQTMLSHSKVFPNGRGIGTYSMKLIGEKVLNGHVSFSTSKSGGTIFKFACPI